MSYFSTFRSYYKNANSFCFNLNHNIRVCFYDILEKKSNSLEKIKSFISVDFKQTIILTGLFKNRFNHFF